MRFTKPKRVTSEFAMFLNMDCGEISRSIASGLVWRSGKMLFKVLRRNCETDWAQRYPQYAVSVWIGHDIQVSARHYLQVPAELYTKVAIINEAETGTKTGTNCMKAEEQERKSFVNSEMKNS